MKNLLVVDPAEAYWQPLSSYFRTKGVNLCQEATIATGLERLAKDDIKAVITEYGEPGCGPYLKSGNPLFYRMLMLARHRSVPFGIVTNWSGTERLLDDYDIERQYVHMLLSKASCNRARVLEAVVKAVRVPEEFISKYAGQAMIIGDGTGRDKHPRVQHWINELPNNYYNSLVRKYSKP